MIRVAMFGDLSILADEITPKLRVYFLIMIFIYYLYMNINSIAG